MKKLLILLLVPVFMLSTMTLMAQDKPSPSPASKLVQKAGTTEITVEYSRPSLKGRTIFPDLHKYDEFWRTGANAATKITFSKDVMVEGKSLSAGSYALLTKPGMTSWGVYLYPYGESGFNTYTSQDPAVMVTVDAVKIECEVETFLIDIGNLRDDSATLDLVWGNTYVPVKLGVK